MDPICLLCNTKEINLKKLGYHVNSFHGLNAKDYTIKVLHEGVEPKCIVCSKETRYVAFTFKRYCKEHSYLAESEAGRVGGIIKKTWNKGKTAKTDSRIIRLLGEKNHFFGKSHSEEAKKAISNKKRLFLDEVKERIAKRTDLKLVSELTEYTYRQHSKLNFVCATCNDPLRMTLTYVERGTRCKRCFPVGSIPETEVANYIRSLGFNIICNDRQTIKPYEIDILIPEKQVGVEYHGLYWHSECNGSRQFLVKRELNKLNLSRANNIKLIQLFSDEWRDKQEICRSMIAHRLGATKIKYYARDCVVEEISAKQSKIFLEASHVDGSTRSKIHFGLISKKTGELVSVLSLRQPNHKKHRELKRIEIARYANAINSVVVGGLSKLLKVIIEWSRNNGYKSILTYADLRFGEGNGYLNNGFELLTQTKYGFFYTDGVTRFDRFKFRAKPGKSENQVAKEAGVHRVYTPGHNIFALNLEDTNI